MRTVLVHAFALPVHERPLQIEPAGELGTLVRHEGGTDAWRRHEPDVIGATAPAASDYPEARCSTSPTL